MKRYERANGNLPEDLMVCPKTGRVLRSGSKATWAAWGFSAIGFLSLLWFLVRVIPKPSRAAYPCQRAAFPVASSFVVWLTALLGSSFAWRKFQVSEPDLWQESRFEPLESYIRQSLDEKSRLQLKLMNPLGVGLHFSDRYLSITHTRLDLLKQDTLMLSDWRPN